LIQEAARFARNKLKEIERELDTCTTAVGNLPEPSKFREEFERAIGQLRAHSSWRLDVRIENLVFQWNLLTGEWGEAGPLLAEFRKRASDEAEVSEGELLLSEALFVEQQGGILPARAQYQQIMDQLDPTSEPILWSRARYGFLRTDLQLRKKSEV